MAPELDRPRLEQVVSAIVAELPGDWLLIGGALVSLWLRPGRTTEDVDVIGLGGTSGERLALMKLAAGLGLPIEAVNSAADFFVERIDGWRDRLVLFRTGSRGRVFRPDATLFLLLKIGRLSQSDLGDCLAMLDESGQAWFERLDSAVVLAALDALPPTSDDALRERRSSLRAALTSA